MLWVDNRLLDQTLLLATIFIGSFSEVNHPSNHMMYVQYIRNLNHSTEIKGYMSRCTNKG